MQFRKRKKSFLSRQQACFLGAGPSLCSEHSLPSGLGPSRAPSAPPLSLVQLMHGATATVSFPSSLPFIEWDNLDAYPAPALDFSMLGTISMHGSSIQATTLPLHSVYK